MRMPGVEEAGFDLSAPRQPSSSPSNESRAETQPMIRFEIRALPDRQEEIFGDRGGDAGGVMGEEAVSRSK